MTRDPQPQSGLVEPPLPDVSERMEPFWQGAREGRLMLQRCGRCARAYFPAVEICSGCLSSDGLAWFEASGRGEVFSYVIMHQIYHPAFAADAPYAVVDVKLEEGPRMISRLVDDHRAEVRVGLPVVVTFAAPREGLALPMFRIRT